MKPSIPIPIPFHHQPVVSTANYRMQVREGNNTQQQARDGTYTCFRQLQEMIQGRAFSASEHPSMLHCGHVTYIHLGLYRLQRGND
jgi:hypothetical protein